MRAIFVGLALLSWPELGAAQLQDLGHRLPAGAGIDAGTQVEPGLYLGYRFVWFSSHEIHDRRGDPLPIVGLEIDAYANVFGLAGTLRAGPLYLSAALAIPVVGLSIRADLPEASVDRLGLGSLFVQPLKLGTRSRHLDVVGSYSFYVPTGQGERSGVGRPEWAHQLAAGGTVFFDDRRGWRVSALASYLHHQRKQGIDITRGDTVLIQGGVAGRVAVIDAGIAGYALWQVRDDTGSELPAALRGARDRAFGLGPEVNVALPALRSRVSARLAFDLDGEARPVGTLLVIGISTVVWR